MFTPVKCWLNLWKCAPESTFCCYCGNTMYYYELLESFLSICTEFLFFCWRLPSKDKNNSETNDVKKSLLIEQSLPPESKVTPVPPHGLKENAALSREGELSTRRLKHKYFFLFLDYFLSLYCIKCYSWLHLWNVSWTSSW